jgi:Holliday junction resolvase
MILLTSLILLQGCSSLWTQPEPKIVTVTKVEQTVIPTVARPKKVQLNDVKIYVVSKENYDEFVTEFEKKNGGDAYIAISVKDYENLALNFAELRRYIEQQKQIIVYYEEAVKPKQEQPKEPNENVDGN